MRCAEKKSLTGITHDQPGAIATRGRREKKRRKGKKNLRFTQALHDSRKIPPRLDATLVDHLFAV
jgi:hypothetical protein